MIRFENVTKRYRGTAKPALNNVDFNVAKGDFVFLVGASGSGKSSCLRLIMREDVASSGRVHVLGEDLKRLPSRRVPYFRRDIGSVFQDFRLLSTKTVFQNIAFALQVTGASRAVTHTNVEQALELVGLTGKEKRMPSELSGGEQQRVAIARAIVGHPKVLLADEPTGNLDPATSTEIMRLLARINANGTTVVMATHEAGFVDQMKRRVIELKHGELMRDEEQGGYGDTSAIPRLVPSLVRGVATAEALSEVRKVQREVARGAAAGAVIGASAVEAAKITKATAETPDGKSIDEANADEAVETEAEVTVVEVLAVEADDLVSPGTAPRPLTRPIVIPEVNVAELGVADRLGLGEFDDDDEVGPTS